MKTHLYDYDSALQQVLNLVRETPMPDASRKAISDFFNYMVARGISKPRTVRVLYILRQAAVLLGMPFADARREDIIRVVAAVEQMKYAESTKSNFRVSLKRFYKWLLGNEEIYPVQVSWIKGNIPRDRRYLFERSQLVTEEDIKRLLEHTHTPRNRAFIALLYESGGRIGEIATLSLKDITFDHYGALVQLNGKTGPRIVRIIQSTPHLALWLSLHPAKEQTTARLWVSTSNSNRGEPMGWASLRKILKQTFARAGIKKKSNAHNLRHARATFLSDYLTEYQMNQILGWVQGSDMPRTYIHASGKRTDEALLRINGIKTETSDKPSPLRPAMCPRCDNINAHDSQFCRKCGLPFSLPAALDAERKTQDSEKAMASLLKDEQVQRVLQEALIRLKLRGVDASQSA